MSIWGKPTAGAGPSRELRLECEHPLAEVIAATPRDDQMGPVIAHARVPATLATQAQERLVHHPVDNKGHLRGLPPAEVTRVLGLAQERTRTLSRLSAELAEALVGPSSLPDAPGGDQATKAALATAVVREDLGNRIELISPAEPLHPERVVTSPAPAGQPASTTTLRRHETDDNKRWPPLLPGHSPYFTEQVQRASPDLSDVRQRRPAALRPSRLCQPSCTPAATCSSSLNGTPDTPSGVNPRSVWTCT